MSSISVMKKTIPLIQGFKNQPLDGEITTSIVLILLFGLDIRILIAYLENSEFNTLLWFLFLLSILIFNIFKASYRRKNISNLPFLMELTLQGLSFLDIKTNKIQYQPWSRITQIIDYRGWVTRGRYGPLVPYREMRIFCGKQFYVIPEAYFPVSMDEIIQNLREFDLISLFI